MNKAASSNSEPTLPAELVNVSGENALQAITKAGMRAEALVLAWVQAGNAAAVNEVAESGQGAARKAARRGLNVLKARGVAIPERARVVNVSGPKATEITEAWLLAPDGNGVSLITIATRTVTSRSQAVMVFLNPAVGIYRVNVLEASQSNLKDAMQGALTGGAYKPVAVPVPWARKRIAETRARQKERGIAEPLGFAGSEALLGPVSTEPVEHPFDAEGFELGDEDVKELAGRSVSLHSLPEFQGWFPPNQFVDELLKKVGETLTAGEEPPPELIQQRVEAEIRAATDRYFTPERRTALLTNMKDSGLSILAREGEVQALSLAATMKCIDRCGLITDPPHEVPFLRAFFDKAIAVLLRQGGGRLRIPVANRPPADAVEPAAT
jgi:hypothetical protein